MNDPGTEQAVIDRLVQWAPSREPIRAMLLYRSRANALGYEYPYDMDRRVTAHLARVRGLDRRADHFA